MAKRRYWTGMALMGLGLAGGPGSAKAADMLFQAEAQHLSGSCSGQAVRLEGNHNTVALTGPCRSLLVKGVANTIQLTIAPGGTIHVEGSQNRIHYAAAGAGPVIEVFGPDNDVSAGSQADSVSPPPPAPAAMPIPAPTPKPVLPPPPAPTVVAKQASEPLTLDGVDQERLADCAGRDVVVSGERSAYVIRGACHSLVVRGDLLTIQAVMQPGARISVAGRGSVVSWAIKGKGHAPASVVRGAESRVQRAEAIGGQPVR